MRKGKKESPCLQLKWWTPPLGGTPQCHFLISVFYIKNDNILGIIRVVDILLDVPNMFRAARKHLVIEGSRR